MEESGKKWKENVHSTMYTKHYITSIGWTLTAQKYSDYFVHFSN